jgi:ElaB/YqjD/DUF883 family membrane-anchored ribosome-binding protein
MFSSDVDTPKRTARSVASRIIDGAQRAAHLSREARTMKTVTQDAIEDAIHMGKRAVRRSLRTLEDVSDDGVRYVRRQPLEAVARTVGTGLLVGLTVGWLVGRFATRTKIR